MSEGGPKFSAAPSAAGYFYQARLALALCIPYAYSDTNIEVVIEGLDDITFQKDATPVELLQTKHHLDRTASLTDASPDLWKTLRIWSEAITQDPTIPVRTRLTLVTTGIAADNSAAALLRPERAYSQDGKRNPKLAQQRLSEIAANSGNKQLEAAFKAFLSLTPEMRSSLLSVVEIVDRQQVVSDLDGVLDDLLKMIAPKGKAAEARERLEGWWWPRVCTSLVSAPPAPIPVTALEAKLDDIRDLLKRDALVAHYEQSELPAEEAIQYDGFRFVRQLQAIGVGSTRIGLAKRDYYRAFTQRSRWLRDHAVLDTELANFESTLIEEWQPRFSAMVEANEGASEEQLKLAGRDVYQWVENDARFPLRTLIVRFLSVGSYHMLANNMRLGWHRDYVTICETEPAE